jgi:CBS domain-containing protein
MPAGEIGERPDEGSVHEAEAGVMHVEQLMSREVVTVTRETTLKEVAALLTKHRISGVPVCDNGQVVGVVSEQDILWKELGLRTGHGLLERFFDHAYGNDERITAATAGEAMTSPAVTVPPNAYVVRAAKLMIDNHINRLPVVSEGKLVGIVTRADLVRAFTRSDEEIEREIREDVLLHTLWVDPANVSLIVVDGDVTVGGEAESRTDAELIEEHIRRVPGVASVSSALRWQVDDRSGQTLASAVRGTRRV